MSKHPQDVDVAFIEALAELLNRNGLSELSVKREYGEDDSLEVRVMRQLAPVAAAPVAAPPVMVAHAAAPAPVAAAPAPSDDPAQHPGCLTSPMVGTVYLAPEPGAQPFVAIGAQVAAGQTVLIIEAMKTMNQIPAPRAGTLRRILIEDGTPVEYGAPLMIID
jgi:acetyl-CoA carboxylase biotin carboxyl carrier protein